MEVLHAAERGLAVSTELLHAGRGEERAPRPVDLRRHILALQPLLGRVAGAGVDTVVVFGDEPLFVRLDRTSAMQVLMNLVSNAAEAMRSSGCIRISAVADDGDAVLVVTDDGPGIPAGLRDKVFDDGYTTKTGAHWGLGLAVVRRVVERCGGTIALDDAVPVGTEIRVRFPLVEPKRSGLALVVAGDDVTRQLLGSALERAGFSVVAAGDPLEACDAVAGRSIVDVALLDLASASDRGLWELARLAEVDRTASIDSVVRSDAAAEALLAKCREASLTGPGTEHGGLPFSR
jgi:two-component sensor histidine kinase/CheY-like chemotaxis protein